MAMSSLFAETESAENTFQVISEFGEGGFGKVWKVESKISGKLCAKREFEWQPWLTKKEDMEDLKNVGAHINVVELIEFGNNYIIMEYCNHGTLDGHMRSDSRLTIQVHPLMRDMLEGLLFLHGKGIVHRDLKPTNILLHRTPDMSRPICKISDFGLTKSHISTYPGTKFYMAPLDFSLDQKAFDVFSLGAIFFVLFSKQIIRNTDREFLAPTIDDMMLHEVKDSRIEAYVTELEVEPEDFCCMIIQMLVKDRTRHVDIQKVYTIFERCTSITS